MNRDGSFVNRQVFGGEVRDPPPATEGNPPPAFRPQSHRGKFSGENPKIREPENPARREGALSERPAELSTNTNCPQCPHGSAGLRD